MIQLQHLPAWLNEHHGLRISAQRCGQHVTAGHLAVERRPGKRPSVLVSEADATKFARYVKAARAKALKNITLAP